MTTEGLAEAKAAETRPRSDYRWLVLVVVSTAQLMVILDATVVNIALPSAQADLGFDNRAAVGRDRLRSRIRQPAAAGRAGR